MVLINRLTNNGDLNMYMYDFNKTCCFENNLYKIKTWKTSMVTAISSFKLGSC